MKVRKLLVGINIYFLAYFLEFDKLIGTKTEKKNKKNKALKIKPKMQGNTTNRLKKKKIPSFLKKIYGKFYLLLTHILNSSDSHFLYFFYSCIGKIQISHERGSTYWGIFSGRYGSFNPSQK